jgi:hypothetical protein
MEAVAYCDDAIEPIHAVKSIRHRKHNNRQQEDQIEEYHAAAGFRRNREPAVMAEPEHAGNNEADRERYDWLRVDASEVTPTRRIRETSGLGQVVGEQRHGNAEDRVAQHFQPAHFEKTGLLQRRSPLKAAGHETRTCFQLLDCRT